MGVTQEGSKYRARFMHAGKRYNVGVFDTRLKAVRALNKKRREVASLNDFELTYEQINTNEPFITSQPGLFERVNAKIRSWLNRLQS